MIVIPGTIIAILTFPGVIMHEYAHKLACEKTGVRVYEVCYFRLGNPVGYVQHAPPRTYKQAFLITVAPFLVNSIIAIAIFIIALMTPITFEIWKIKVRYILYWLGVSIAMHAFPSSHDAKNLWDFTWRVWKRKPYILLGLPIVALIYLANLLSYIWFDLIYALFLLISIVSLVKVSQTDPIINLAKEIIDIVYKNIKTYSKYIHNK